MGCGMQISEWPCSSGSAIFRLTLHACKKPIPFPVMNVLVADCIYNGICTARMRVNKIIPSSLYIGAKPLRIWYPTQPKMCRRCCAEDHLVKECRLVRCFNCEMPGHVSDECPSPPLCSICLEEDHAAILCPFLLFSANVDENPGNASYTEVAGTMTG